MVALRKTSKTSPSSNIPLISTILFIQWAHYIILGLFFHQIHRNHGSPVFNPSVAQFNIQSGRNIRHLPCVVRRSGVEGVCMFAIDCIKANGTHLGTCIDRFYFGSCCKLKDDADIIGAEIVENSIDQNTIPHFSFGMPLQSTTVFNPTYKTTSKQIVTTTRPIVTTTATIRHHNSSATKNVQKTTTFRPTSTTTKYIPITTVLNTESKTEASNEQQNLDEITITTSQNVITSRMPTSTEENVKLQTFQSVQEETTFASTAKAPIMTEFITVKPNIPVSTLSTTELVTKENLLNKLQATTVSMLTVAPNHLTTTTMKPILSTSTMRTTSKITSSHRPISSTPKVNDTNSISTNATHSVSTSTKRTTAAPNVSTSSNADNFSTPTKIASKGTIAPTKSPIITTHRTAMPTNRPLADLVTWSHLVTGMNATKNPPEWILISSVMPVSSSTPRIESMKTTESPTISSASSTSPSSTLRPAIVPETTRFPTRKPQIPSSPKTTTIKNPTTTNNDMSIIIEGTTMFDGLDLTTIATEDNDFDHTTMQPIYTSTTYKIETTTHSRNESTTLHGSSYEYENISTTKPIKGNNGTLDIAQESSLDTTTAPMLTSPTANISLSSSTEEEKTTVSKLESTTEPVSLTIAHLPLNSTNLEIYEIEGSSATENVTLEFVDLPTTEAILSSTSISQYLETANFKQVCGKRMYPEPRIVGGSKASFGRWPWQISLRQWRTSTYLHKCGAALLNENWAITAAHCVDNVPPSDLLLRLGEYDLAEEEEPYLYQERRVQIVASHPQFDPRTFEYDLALLRFYEPVVFQPNIIPVCVPETDENFIGRTAFVTGWGRLYEDGPLPSVLQEVSVPVINNTLCEGMYRNAGYIEHIPHIFICAGYRKGGYDSCEGDSGGPMVIQREDKRFLLAGVISWGIGCAEPNQPGVYTRISEFREWINQILQF